MDTTKLTQFANEIVRIHNNPVRYHHLTVNHPEYMDIIEFTGNIRQENPKLELLPNEKNPALMDECEITSYSGEFICKYRKVGGKRVKTFKTWYYIGQNVKRLEIGSYWDKR